MEFARRHGTTNRQTREDHGRTGNAAVGRGLHDEQDRGAAAVGTSALGMSLTITATPDVLSQDGASQSQIVVVIRNANSQPVGGVGLRVETLVGSTIADLGRLSSKTPMTGTDGRATMTSRPRLGASSGNTQNEEILVTIRVVPIGTDYAAALDRTL